MTHTIRTVLSGEVFDVEVTHVEVVKASAIFQNLEAAWDAYTDVYDQELIGEWGDQPSIDEKTGHGHCRKGLEHVLHFITHMEFLMEDIEGYENELEPVQESQLISVVERLRSLPADVYIDILN